MKKRRLFIQWVFVVATAIGLLTVAAVDSSDGEATPDRIARLTNSYACPTCDGQSVADSNAPVSITIREAIADAVAAGATDAEITDQLVQAYGEGVRLEPPTSGWDALLWVLPVGVFSLAAAGVAAAVTRRQEPAASAEDQALVAAALATFKAGDNES